MTSSYFAWSPSGQISPRAVLGERFSHIGRRFDVAQSFVVNAVFSYGFFVNINLYDSRPNHVGMV